MPKKKKEEGVLAEEIMNEQDHSDDTGPLDFNDTPEEFPSTEGGAESDGQADAEKDAGSGDEKDASEEIDNPAEDESAMDEPPSGIESDDPVDGDTYGNLGDTGENDPFSMGDGPPQFDLPEAASPPEGALMLDSPTPDSTEEATAAPEDYDADAEETPAPVRRRKRTAASAAQDSPDESTASAPALRRRTNSTDGVISIDEDLKIQSTEDKDALLWMELRGSLRSKRILTGTMGGVERTPTGGCIAVVYYKEQRIVIPADEMFIDINVHQTESTRELQNRYAQILTRTLNAEVDFIISGIDRRAGSVVASRKEAMIRKQINYYHPSARRRTPLIEDGMIVEARIVSVGTKNIRVEIFGVETTIWARFVAWEWVEDCADYYQVGDRVLVKIMSIDRANPERLTIEASVRDCVQNPAMKNIEKCQAQGKYIGKVTGMDPRAIYVRLNVGVNGIATACHDRKVPGRKDDVSFVITRLDKEQGVAIGIITKIIKQHL